MSMSISGLTSSSWGSSSSFVDSLFSKIDKNNQGYLSLSDVESALGATSSSSSSTSTTASADALFKAMDSNSDGQVSKQEFTDVISKIAQGLGEQMLQGQLSGTQASGPPPPPPPDAGDDDQGLTKDQLSTMASSATAGSQQATDLTALVTSFDAADTNGDGKVSFQEAMAFKQSQSASSTTSTTDTQASSEDSSIKRLLQVVAQYLSNAGADASSSVSGIHLTA